LKYKLVILLTSMIGPHHALLVDLNFIYFKNMLSNSKFAFHTNLYEEYITESMIYNTIWTFWTYGLTQQVQ